MIGVNTLSTLCRTTCRGSFLHQAILPEHPRACRSKVASAKSGGPSGRLCSLPISARPVIFRLTFPAVFHILNPTYAFLSTKRVFTNA